MPVTPRVEALGPKPNTQDRTPLTKSTSARERERPRQAWQMVQGFRLASPARPLHTVDGQNPA